jgi:hypothetical protein
MLYLSTLKEFMLSFYNTILVELIFKIFQLLYPQTSCLAYPKFNLDKSQ